MFIRTAWRRMILVIMLALVVSQTACSLLGGGDTRGDTGSDTGADSGATTGDAPTGGDQPDSPVGDTPTPEPTPTPTEAPTPTPTPQGITQKNAAQVSQLRTLSHPAGSATALTAVAFSPDSQHVATYGWSKIVTVWDVNSGNVAAELSGPTEYGLGLEYSPDGTRLAAAGADYRAHIWDVSNNSLVTTMQTNIWANRARFSPDGTMLAVAGSSSSSMKIYNTETGSEITAIKPGSSVLWSAAFSPDGQYVAVGNDRGGIFVYSMSNYSLVKQLEPTFTDQVNDIEFSPDSSMIAAGYDEGNIAVWSTSNWARTMNARVLSPTWVNPGLMDMAFSRDSSVILAGGGEGRLVIMEVQGGGVVKEIVVPTVIWAISVSGDGNKAALAMDNGDLIIIGLPGT